MGGGSISVSSLDLSRAADISALEAIVLVLLIPLVPLGLIFGIFPSDWERFLRTLGINWKHERENQ
jgi:hypothetical protein